MNAPFSKDDKVLVLAKDRGFFMAEGIHLVNPERPFVVLPENFVPGRTVKAAIDARIVIDYNGNLDKEPGKIEIPKDKPFVPTASSDAGEVTEEETIETEEAPAKNTRKKTT